MVLLPTLLKTLGGGLGIFGALQGASAAEDMADLNHEIDRYNAASQLAASMEAISLDRVRSRIERTGAKTNYQLALLEAESGDRNAERLRAFADAGLARNREQIRRQLRAFEEFQGTQIATQAASGTTLSGSALELMADAVDRFEMGVRDMNDAATMEWSETLWNAALEQNAANVMRYQARGEWNMAKLGARLSRTARKGVRRQAQAQYKSTLLSAEMSRLAGRDTAAGMRQTAVGQALTGVGNFLTTRHQQRQIGL